MTVNKFRINHKVSKINEYIYRKRYGIMAFLIPFLAVLIANIGMGIYPFGERAVNIIDSYHQYAPFFSEFYHKIIDGENLFYTWNGGMGVNFWSIIVYYLSSPLNIIVLLFPRKYLLEAFALIIMLKIALSGWSFSCYIRKHYKKNNISVIFFSSFYALSGWMIGYSWNIMWIDCVVLFPLIILGLERLFKEGRGIFYAVMLGLSIFFNYYISIMICIFLVLYFFILFIQKRHKSFRMFIRKGFQFAGYSLLAGGLAAVMLLPEMYTLMATHSAESSFPEKIKFYKSFLDILGQHLAFTEPTSLSGLPNLYCGVFVLLCIVLYLFRKKTPWIYKITRLLLLVFLIFSCNVNVLDFIWHGFHYPNSLPNRFTFIYIFLLLTMAYEVVLSLRQYTIGHYFAAFLVSVFFVLLVYLKGNQDRELYVYLISLAFIWVYMLLMCLYKMYPRQRQIFSIMLCCILSLEAASNGVYGLCTNGSINRTLYNQKLEDANSIQAYISHDGDEGLYRTELDQFHGRNNAMWLGFKSVSLFSSTLSDGLDETMDHLGFFAAVNKFSYEGSTRLTDDIFGIKYLVSESQKENIRGFHYLKQVGNLHLYQNDHVLPIAFMVNEGYKQWSNKSDYPWMNLNEFVRCTTGIEEDLFDIEYLTGEPVTRGGTVSKQDEYTYSFVRQDGASEATVELIYHPTYLKERYIYYDASRMKKLKVDINGTTRSYSDTRGHIIDLGSLQPGDEVKFTFTLKSDYNSGKIMLALFGMNEDIYEQAWGQLSENGLNIVDKSEVYIRGNIHADEDGLLFTSIPYDGGWKVKVDGKVVQPQSQNEGLMYLELEKGDHEVEMSFMPQGFLSGLMISVLSLFIVIILVMRNKKREINLLK